MRRTNNRQPEELSTYSCARRKSENLEKILERNLGALRFSKKNKLKHKSFEAHHGWEANTVVGKITMKPSLKSLNWYKVIFSKYACLDKRDLDEQRIPQPADKNGMFRSDNDFNVKNRRHPINLKDDQINDQGVEPALKQNHRRH